MSPAIAAIAFTAGILGLFMLDRDPKVRSSFALAIPMVWLSIGGSRVVSEWLNPTTTMAGEAYIEGNPLDRNIQTMLMVAGMAVLFRRRRKAGRLLRANAPILIFFGYCALSILWSDYPATSFRRWVKAVGDVVMVMVVLTDPDPSAAVKMPARVGFILMPASILLMRYFPEMARGFDSITGQPAYTGVTTSKNSLGMICLIFGLGAVWRFLGAYWSRERAGRAGRLLAHGAVVVLVFWLLRLGDSSLPEELVQSSPLLSWEQPPFSSPNS